MGIEDSERHEVEEQQRPYDAEDYDIRLVVAHAKGRAEVFNGLNAPVKERINPLEFAF